jgi:predicted NAD-dependent protein-ADP-ribosyltransferase YbiA (DUF1768 family)
MEEKIRTAETPGEAKKLGQTRKVTLRSDWEQVLASCLLRNGS